MEKSLQQEFLDLLLLLQNLSAGQLAGFLSFVRHGNPRIDLGMLTQLVQQCSPEQLEKLASSSLGDESQYPQDFSKELLKSVAALSRLQYLQSLLTGFSEMQLMKLHEMVPLEYDQSMQLSLLQQIQELLNNLHLPTLQNLQKELEDAEPGQEREHLVRLLELPSEHFHIYQPMQLMLNLEWEELQGFHHAFPKLIPIQLMQLLQLFKLDLTEMLEMRQLLLPRDSGQSFTDMDAEPTLDPSIDASRPHVFIVEQPPEKQVYKRNLKPNPVVRVVFNDAELDGSIYVAPVLVRCDTLEEQPKLMIGTQPVKITSSKIVTFRKLKITSTSHQQGETLFCIRFELRRYRGSPSGGDYDVINFVQSNPICVLSHSTQLKPSASSTITPVVAEVIPFSGSITGGTRVAVLGSNFVDNPALRVRFDSIDVMPIFHGPGTLICTTPQHAPGVAIVRVTNDNRRWSDTTGQFTYEDISNSTEGMTLMSYVPSSLPPDIDLSGISEAAWQGNFDNVKLFAESGSDVNQKDARQFTALHYASANGHAQIVAFLISRGAVVNLGDGQGRSALYWAVSGGHGDVAEFLLSCGADPNALSFDGDSPLHLAVRSHLGAFVELLLNRGARPQIADLSGVSALHAAVAMMNAPLAKTLIMRGAWVNAADDEGESPLFYALRSSSVEMVQLLLSAGASPEQSNGDGEKPLHLAAMFESEAIPHLLRRGARVNAQDSEGQTPLHHSLLASNVPAAEALLGANANVNLFDNYGTSALHLALLNGADHVVGPLLQGGCDPNHTTREGFSAFELAPRHLQRVLASADEAISFAAAMKGTHSVAKALRPPSRSCTPPPVITVAPALVSF